jgi:hypothetical protein
VRRAGGKARSETSMLELIENRSDKIPGMFTCVECGQVIGSLQESWRRPPDPLTGCSLSTLFCVTCAQRLNGIGAELAPTALTRIEQLNLGVAQECFK